MYTSESSFVLWMYFRAFNSPFTVSMDSLQSSHLSASVG